MVGLSVVYHKKEQEEGITKKAKYESVGLTMVPPVKKAHIGYLHDIHPLVLVWIVVGIHTLETTHSVMVGHKVNLLQECSFGMKNMRNMLTL